MPKYMYKNMNISTVNIAIFISMAAVFLDLLCGILLRNVQETFPNRSELARELQVLDKSSPGLATEFDNDHYNLTSHSAWAALIPNGRGIVTMGTESAKFQVALYQQLECINEIRISVLHLYNVTTSDAARLPDFNKTENCFGNLRQLLLCTADTTLETPGPPILVDGSIEMGLITGLGVSHKCSDWEKVRESVNNL